MIPHYFLVFSAFDVDIVITSRQKLVNMPSEELGNTDCRYWSAIKWPAQSIAVNCIHSKSIHWFWPDDGFFISTKLSLEYNYHSISRKHSCLLTLTRLFFKKMGTWLIFWMATVQVQVSILRKTCEIKVAHVLYITIFFLVIKKNYKIIWVKVWWLVGQVYFFWTERS